MAKPRDTLFAGLSIDGIRKKMLILQVNGAPRELPPGSNIESLIASMQLGGKRIAIELNGEIVPKSRHAHTALREGDTLEIVVAVGGG